MNGCSLVLTFILGICLFARGQQLNSFTLTDVVSGRTVSLSDYANGRGLVIIFISNDCPYDTYYVHRIKSLAEAFPDLPFLLVNGQSSQNKDEVAMKRAALRTGWGLPYLADRSKQLAQNIRPTKSPEAILFRNDQGKFTIVYRGAIDDNPQVETDVNTPYLQNAIDQLIASKTVHPSNSRPVGCSIR